MTSISAGYEFVSRSYFRTHQDPIEHADEIVGVRMIRDPDTAPTGPLRLAIDQSVLDHMGWRPGDALTLIPVQEEGRRHRGSLIIRRARPGDIALLLTDPFCLKGWDSEGRRPAEVHGPHFEWCFPAPWVEAFLPGDYDEDEHDFNSQTERHWSLAHVLGQEGQVELPLGPEKLFLYLQRTSPTPTTLDVHLIPGLTHQRSWSRRTPLVLESESGFDPFATEDVLTIRENSLGEEPNLVPARVGSVADVNPLWLDRFFPDRSDASDEQEASSSWPGSDSDPVDAWFATAGRDTFVVGYNQMADAGHSLSFKITQPEREA